ncbi:2-hydroxymuconate semialdehyde hydrolase [Anaerolineae bacterium]|nr:2-hydroxymuconate semialdehyde hydrolase [Anaerolineae bacterium]
MNMKKLLLRVVPLSIISVGAATVVARYQREICVARKRVTSLGSQVIETASGPIEYARIGDGYPVLVVHGAMGGFDQGLWLAQAFDISKHQVISVSRFGYLRTPVPADANLDLQADAFACLLDALGIRQAAVFAVSAGSTSAIRFAARHPERISALILLCPDAPGQVQTPALATERSARPVRREAAGARQAGASVAMPPRFVFDTLLRSDFIYWALVTFFGKWVQNAIGLVPRGYVLTPEYVAQIKKIQAGDLPVSQRVDGLIFETYACADEFNASTTATSPYPLSQIETPALVINALDDPISIPENVRGLAEQMPNARLFVVPDGGHFLFGHTEKVKTEITQFLRNNVALLKNSQ